VSHSWIESSLWKELAERTGETADAVRHLIVEVMPQIQLILDKGGTASLDFTLHDADHSFRVAERMFRLMPQSTAHALGSYELALLLLGAYLHDIGMTPEQSSLGCLYRYLLTGENKQVPEQEAQILQGWLDDHYQGITLPIVVGPITNSTLDTADEMLTHYARYRHNDWGASWVRTHLQGKALGHYSGWLDDLIAVCKSHHYDYEALVTDEFKPRLIGGSDAQVVNLRYLAVVLRVADVLEFDPERTPDVIFQHRHPSSSSVIFWHKDHDITMLQEGRKIIITARPKCAKIHKALIDTVAQIDYELSVCRRIAENYPFDACPPLSVKTLHKWEIDSECSVEIRPHGNSYEYIDGAFRPDTQRLLGLLSGEALYRTPLAAVRELLQNAMDAVRERIAYIRLATSDPSYERNEDELGSRFEVSLELQVDSAGTWLVCADTGIGMTKRIITDHVLVSGGGSRRDLAELERRCRKAGFALGRTGQFGIGVLSYFMIAQRVEISTRRSQEAFDADPTGWVFTTDGIGSFGELRQDKGLAAGTTVRLLLHPHILSGDNEKWAASVTAYSFGILRRTPCRLTFFEGLSTGVARTVNPGWCGGQDELRSFVLETIDAALSESRSREVVDVSILPEAERDRRAAELAEIQRLKSEILGCLCTETIEGHLPNLLGRYRVRIAYFSLLGGKSFAFLRPTIANKIIHLSRIRDGLMISLEGRLQSSWKGISADILSDASHRVSRPDIPAVRYMRRFFERLPTNSLIEVDLNISEAASVSVDRDSMELTTNSAIAYKSVFEHAISLIHRIAESNSESLYQSLNLSIAGNIPAPHSRKPYWAISTLKEQVSWVTLAFPVIDSTVFSYGPAPTAVKWKNRKLQIVRALGGPTRGDHYEGRVWHGRNVSPDKILVAPSYRVLLCPVWEKPPSITSGTHLEAQFPPNWGAVAGAHIANYAGLDAHAIVWNANHSLSRHLDSDVFEWRVSTLGDSNDPLPHRSEVLSNREYAVAWTRCCLENGLGHLWNGILERDATFLPELFEVIDLDNKGGELPQMLFLVQESTSSRLRAASLKGWTVIRDDQQIARSINKPAADWRLNTEENEDGARLGDAWRIKHNPPTRSPKKRKR
jgi:hypothetical protein